MTIDCLVEGIVDESIARKIIRFAGHQPGISYGKRGWNYIVDKLDGFAVRARFGNPILVLIDFMDLSKGGLIECPPQTKNLLKIQEPKLILRTVVKEIESWILADHQAIADFLNLSIRVIPRNPESLLDPKQELIRIARRSRNRKIREGIVPRRGSKGNVGPNYTQYIVEFVEKYWSVGRAAANSKSLNRCVTRLEKIISI